MEKPLSPITPCSDGAFAQGGAPFLPPPSSPSPPPPPPAQHQHHLPWWLRGSVAFNAVFCWVTRGDQSLALTDRAVVAAACDYVLMRWLSQCRRLVPKDSLPFLGGSGGGGGDGGVGGLSATRRDVHGRSDWRTNCLFCSCCLAGLARALGLGAGRLSDVSDRSALDPFGGSVCLGVDRLGCRGFSPVLVHRGGVHVHWMCLWCVCVRACVCA